MYDVYDNVRAFHGSKSIIIATSIVYYRPIETYSSGGVGRVPGYCADSAMTGTHLGQMYLFSRSLFLRTLFRVTVRLSHGFSTVDGAWSKKFFFFLSSSEFSIPCRGRKTKMTRNPKTARDD